MDEEAVAHIRQHGLPDRLVERQQILESLKLPTMVMDSPKILFTGRPDFVHARLVAVRLLERQDHGAHRIRDLVTPPGQPRSRVRKLIHGPDHAIVAFNADPETPHERLTQSDRALHSISNTRYPIMRAYQSRGR
ncbi:hypothetical protein PUR34_00830 [Streptomyces sp. JV185]|uniref:hypothetical protein n=1 Tax=Streptomyces sp. JV185 TaxID=858638 RepID=UPI002E78AA45|nr:hypothetical protein [Streptomyces sp. JV185]MEE1766805.1 hypothetical protein [Streptomyces sp. JV185]